LQFLVHFQEVFIIQGNIHSARNSVIKTYAVFGDLTLLLLW